jgi:hypothetical protein
MKTQPKTKGSMCQFIFFTSAVSAGDLVWWGACGRSANSEDEESVVILTLAMLGSFGVHVSSSGFGD